MGSGTRHTSLARGGILELEVDEGLEVGGDELVEDEDQEHEADSHDPQGQLREPQAVTAFEARRQQVHDHAHHEEEEGHPIGRNHIGDDAEVPVRPYLVHHGVGGTPRHLVGLDGVEVGAAAEEKSCKADKEEGKGNIPHHPRTTHHLFGLRQEVQYGESYKKYPHHKGCHIEQRQMGGVFHYGGRDRQQ